jgi:hypothetical protein
MKKPINLRNEILDKLNDDKFYQMPDHSIFKKQRTLFLDNARYILFNKMYGCFYQSLYVKLMGKLKKDLNE